MEKFWLDDPNILWNSFNFIPTMDMSNAERLNSVTRLLIIVTLILYASGYQNYYVVLLLGIVLIIALRTTCQRENRENFGPHRGGRPCRGCGFDSNQSYINAKYEVTPLLQFNHDNASKRSYTNAKYEVTPLDVPAPYREVWRNEPEYCGEFTMIPNPYTISPVGEQDLPRGQCHYITRSYVDHLPISQSQTGLVSARPAVESAWMRDSQEFRNSIMGEHIDRFARERQHNCTDLKIGRKTF